MRGVGLVLCVVSLGFGCSKSSKPADNGSGSAAPRPGPLDPNAPNIVAPASDEPSCEERAIALGEKLAEKPIYDRTQVTVPLVSRGRAIDEVGTQIVVGRDGDIIIEGKAIPDEVKLAIYVERTRGPYSIEIESTASIEPLALLAKTLPKSQARLIVARDIADDRFANVTIPKGAGDWVAPLIEQLRTETDPGKRGRLLQDGMKRAMGTECKELPEAFAKVGNANPAELDHVLATTIHVALDRCGCKGVDPGFETLMTLGRSRTSRFGWLPLEAPLDAKAKTAGELAKLLAEREPK